MVFSCFFSFIKDQTTAFARRAGFTISDRSKERVSSPCCFTRLVPAFLACLHAVPFEQWCTRILGTFLRRPNVLLVRACFHVEPHLLRVFAQSEPRVIGRSAHLGILDEEIHKNQVSVCSCTAASHFCISSLCNRRRRLCSFVS